MHYKVLFERVLVVAALPAVLADEGVAGAVRAPHVTLHVDLLNKSETKHTMPAIASKLDILTKQYLMEFTV